MRVCSVVFLALLVMLRGPVALGWVDPSTGLPYATQVLRAFDPPEKPWLAGHRGVDLALAPGAPVRAAADGVVHFAGMVAGTPVVSIQHEEDGLRTTYQPVWAFVEVGQVVREGQEIGTLGYPEQGDGYPGLHWGARVGKDEYRNPLDLLEVPTIRLKPVS